MTGSGDFLAGWLAVVAAGACALGASAQAQIATDGSLGPAMSLSGPDFAIPHTLGTLAGSRNLFHSFSTFNLATGQSATFSGPSTVQNVLARVTGGTRSDIDGTIASSIAGANLYLMNPSGIVFGPNASLSVSGSFHATTADYVTFGDGARFFANPASASTLSVADPTAFGFLSPAPATLVLDGTSLTVPAGKTLSFVAGDLSVNAALTASRGTVNLLASGGPGELGLDGASMTPGGAIAMLSSVVNVSGNGGGNVRITGGTLALDNSSIFSGNTGATDSQAAISIRGGNVLISGGSLVQATASGTGRGPAIVVAVSDTLSIDASTVQSATLGGPLALGGAVTVSVTDLSMTSGASLFSGTLSAATAGDMTVAASRNLTIASGSSIGGGAFSSGNGGAVAVSAGQAMLIDGSGAGGFTGIASQVNPGAAGQGGRVDVVADSLTLHSGGSITSSTQGGGVAGAVRVSAGDVALRTGATIATIALAGGDAGAIAVTAARSVDIDGTGSTDLTGITSQANAGTGNAGPITVTAGKLALSGRGQIIGATGSAGAGGLVSVVTDELTLVDGAVTSGTFGAGRAGGVDVAVAGNLLIDGRAGGAFTGIGSQANPGSSGNAGAVNVAAGNLTMLAGSEISSSAFASGQGGAVKVTVGRDLVIDGTGAPLGGDGLPLFTGIASQANRGSTGNAGSVDVAAANLRILAGGKISTSTLAGGSAGVVGVSVGRDLVIDGTGALDFTGIASIAVGGSTGRAGAVGVTTGNLTLLSGGKIASDTFGAGDAGQVAVTARQSLLADGTGSTDFTGITSQAGVGATGNAGAVSVSAQDLTLRAAVIGSDTFGPGDAGRVTVAAGGHLLIDGSQSALFTGISSQANDGTGNAGAIGVRAGSLTLLDGGVISSSTFAFGNAGVIDVDVAGRLLVDGTGGTAFTGISTQANAGSTGQAGRVGVAAADLALVDGGQIVSTTASTGNAGAVLVTAGRTFISGTNTGISSSSLSPGAASGDAGTVRLSGGSLSMANGGQIASNTTGGGRGGDVQVAMTGDVLLEGAGTRISATASGRGDAGSILVVADAVELKNGAQISTEAAVGGGGNITILADRLLYLLSSQITTSVAGGSGSGGDIFIDPDFVVLNKSRIVANAVEGNGGNITITAGRFLKSSDSVVEASSELGIDGQISISSPDADVTAGLAQLPGGLAENVQLSQLACTAPGETPVLSLVPVGRGGLALVPDANSGQAAFFFAGGPRSQVAAAAPAAVTQLAQFQALPMQAAAAACRQ